MCNKGQSYFEFDIYCTVNLQKLETFNVSLSSQEGNLKILYLTQANNNKNHQRDFL